MPTWTPPATGARARASLAIEPERDALEHEAWTAANARVVPILGVCRGMQAINVFSGGTLLQHVEGHAGPRWGAGPATTHPLRLAPGSRLTRILFPTNARGGVVRVNSYHHQGVRPADLAPGLVASAWASSPAGELVEGPRSVRRPLRLRRPVPSRAGRIDAAGVRAACSRVFVDAARGPADRR